MGKFIFDCLQSNNYCTGNNNAGQWEGYTTEVISLSDDWLLGSIVPAGPKNAVQYNAGGCYLGGDGGLTTDSYGNLTLGGNQNLSTFPYVSACSISNFVFGYDNRGRNLCNTVLGGYKNSNIGGFGFNDPTLYIYPSSANNDSRNGYNTTLNLVVLTGDGSLGSQTSIQRQRFFYFDRPGGNPLNESAQKLQCLYFQTHYAEFYNSGYPSLISVSALDTPYTINVQSCFPTTTGMYTMLYTNSGNNPESGGGQGCNTDVWGGGSFCFTNGTQILSTPNYTTWCFQCVYYSDYRRRYLTNPNNCNCSCYINDYRDFVVGSSVCINSPLDLQLSASFVFEPSVIPFGIYPSNYYTMYMSSTNMYSVSVGPRSYYLSPNRYQVTHGQEITASYYLGVNLGGCKNLPDYNTVIVGGNCNRGNYSFTAGSECTNPYTGISLGSKNSSDYIKLGAVRNSNCNIGGYCNTAYALYYEGGWQGACNVGPVMAGYNNGARNNLGNGYMWRRIIAGENNSVYDFTTNVIGGSGNYGANSYGAVWGGIGNGTSYSLVMGGEFNIANNGRSVILAGCNNCVMNNYPTEYYNTVTTIGAGYNNITCRGGHYGSILAGHDNASLSGHAHTLGSNITAAAAFYTNVQNLSSQCKTEADGLNVNSLSAGKAICNPSTTYTGMFLTVNVAGSALLLPLYS